ncbi:MAG: hypothetical protein WD035_00265 [Balneolaceae bacterium]
MGEEVYIVAIVFGSVVTIVTLGIVGGIIKAWVRNRNNGSITNDENFLEALREFKEKTDHRLSKLESQQSSQRKVEEKKSERNEKTINIDSEKQDSDSSSGQNLKNMLKE